MTPLEPIPLSSFPAIFDPPSGTAVRMVVGIGLVILGAIVGITMGRSDVHNAKMPFGISPPYALVGGTFVLMGIGTVTGALFSEGRPPIEP